MNNPQSKVLNMLEADIINVNEAIRLLEALTSSAKINRMNKTKPDNFIPPTFPSYFNGLANNIN